jgi:aspartate aminotransferase
MNSKYSKTANNLSTLSITAIAEKINKKIACGEKIYNLTIGDFATDQFSIPEGLGDEIGKAYR